MECTLKSTPKINAVYLVINKLTKEVYVGSTKHLYSRLNSHINELLKGTHHNKPLQQSYDIHGKENFEFKYKIVEYTEKERHYFEERFIALYPCFNQAKEPTKGGSPNKGRKLPVEWVKNLHANNSYKHSDNAEILEKVTKQNKEGSTKLRFYKDGEELIFDSWVLASEYFKVTPSALMKLNNVGVKRQGYSLEVLRTQKKKIKLYHPDGEKIFNSFGECDRYVDMWRGATSFYYKRDGKINNMKLEEIEITNEL